VRQLPITGRTTPHGGYGYRRSTATHWGVDLGAPPGTPVLAPEALRVIAVSLNNITRPLSGYGPAAVLATGSSGYVHVLGHLSATVWPAGGRPDVGRVYQPGEQVGVVGAPRHLHWEVRRGDAAPWPRSTRRADTVDPLAWLVEAPEAPEALEASAPSEGVFDRVAAVAAELRRVAVRRAVVSTAVSAAGWILLGYVFTRRRR